MLVEAAALPLSGALVSGFSFPFAAPAPPAAFFALSLLETAFVSSPRASRLRLGSAAAVVGFASVVAALEGAADVVDAEPSAALERVVRRVGLALAFSVSLAVAVVGAALALKGRRACDWVRGFDREHNLHAS